MLPSASRWWLAAFAICVSVAFSSALRAPFEFDDNPAIRLNPTIRQLTPLSVPLSPPQNTSVAGRPVVNLTFAVNYAIDRALGVDANGPNATVGLHVVNVLIHLVCGLLLFGVIRRTVLRIEGLDATWADGLAGITTLLWLVHPIQTEAVHYLVQRTELMVSAFALGTLYASMRAWDAGANSRRWLVVGVAACVGGMLSKEVMVGVPLIVLLYDRAFRAGSFRDVFASRDRRRFYGALFATTLIVVTTTLLGARNQSVGFGLGMSPIEYAWTQAWAVPHYLRLIAWPNALNIDYGDRVVSGLAPLPGAILLVALAAGTLFAWQRPSTTWLGFLGASFFILLVPSSSVMPIRTEIAAERRIYLASAAVLIVAVVGAVQLVRRLQLSTRVTRAGGALLTASLIAATYGRGLTYASTETLYRDVVDKAPDNPRGYIGVALALFTRDMENTNEAEGLLRKAASIDTASFLAWHSLGVMKLAQSHWQDAADLFVRALRIAPENRDAISGAARAYIELQDANAAMPFVDRLGATNAPALWAMGNLLVRKKRGPEAVRYLELAAATGKPSSLGVALLSLAYAQSDDVEQARQAAQVATARAGDTADVYNLAARAMIAAKRPEEARTYLQAALALDPTSEPLRRALDSLDSLQSRKKAQ